METNQETGGIGRHEKQFKILAICLGVVAVALVGVLVWIWLDRQGMINDLTVDKENLTSQMVQLRTEYNDLNTSNDSLNVQLGREREKVDLLIERVEKTEATNRSQIRQYEKELGTLRSIMRNYITQIDSLNTLATTLREDAAAARTEARKSRQDYDNLKTTADEYARQVEIGSVVQGRGFHLTAIMANGKDTERSSRTEKLKCCFSLMENNIAKKGVRQVFLRIKGPDGVVMTMGEESVFSTQGESLIYSASREVDYQGQDIEICVFFGASGMFSKGVYTADVYTQETKLGTIDILLK